jgi:hypothetical protein
MNWRFTAIVFLVFVALAVFAYTQRAAPSVQVGEGAPTATPQAVLDLKAEDVQEVEVQGAGSSYKLARVAGGWQVDGEATSDEVAGVVERMAKLAVVRDLPGDRNPEDYGFSTPSLTVTLKLAAGDAHVLQIGDDTPVDYNVYVRLKDQPRIAIVSKSDISRLKDWLTTRPFAPTATGTSTPEGTPAAPAETPAGAAGSTEAVGTAAVGEGAAGGSGAGEPTEATVGAPATSVATAAAATATPSPAKGTATRRPGAAATATKASAAAATSTKAP